MVVLLFLFAQTPFFVGRCFPHWNPTLGTNTITANSTTTPICCGERSVWKNQEFIYSFRFNVNTKPKHPLLLIKKKRKSISQVYQEKAESWCFRALTETLQDISVFTACIIWRIQKPVRENSIFFELTNFGTEAFNSVLDIFLSPLLKGLSNQYLPIAANSMDIKGHCTTQHQWLPLFFFAVTTTLAVIPVHRTIKHLYLYYFSKPVWAEES